MYQIIIVFHVLFGLGVIGLVLIQQGKGADAGAAFGTGSSGSVFGAQGAASFLSRTTAILAALFFTTSLGLAVLNSHKGVAYDLMSTTSDEKTAAPATESSEKKESDTVPIVPQASIPASSSPEKSVPEQSPVPSAAEIKETTVPKAEEIKTVEEKPFIDQKQNNKSK